MLFFSWYPSIHNTKDGMMQRVITVDNFFIHVPRTYIAYSIWKNFRKKITQPSKNVIYLELNIVFHSKTIITEIRKASNIYIHSIFNCLPLYMYHSFTDKVAQSKTYTLDLHGIVPEELEFNGRKHSFWLFKKVEKWAFENMDQAVFVTKAMQLYLLSKYRDYKGQSLVFNIYPKINDLGDNVEIAKKIDTNKTVIIYSGNLSKWQNIDLMLQTIKSNISNKLSFVILTGDKPNFEKMLEQYGLNNQVVLLSLSPAELPAVYKIADYGFVLRTDMPINKVANPTKLIEYLHFGIVPIVLSEKIGDFYNMGYDYIALENFSDQLPKRKSIRNREIAAQIKKQNLQADLYSFVLGKASNSIFT